MTGTPGSPGTPEIPEIDMADAVAMAALAAPILAAAAVDPADDPDDPDLLPPLQAAAAFTGLALNPNLYIGDRLDCALTAVKHYEHWTTGLRTAVENELDRSDDRSFGYLMGLRWVLDRITGEGDEGAEDAEEDSA